MSTTKEEKEEIAKISFFSAFKRALSLVRNEWGTLGWGIFFLLLGSGMGLAFPQAIRIVIDGTLDGGMVSINTATLVMLGIFLVQGASVSMRSYLFSLVGFRVVTGLQRRTYQWIMQQEIGFFDKRKTGELLNRLSSDSTVLQSAVSANISMLLRNTVMTVGGFGLLIYTSPVLTMLMLVVVPPVSLGAVYFGKKIRNLSKKVQDGLARAGEIAEETIAGIRTVRSFAKEPLEDARYATAITRAFQSMKDRAIGMSLFVGITTFAGYSSVALVLWYGGRLVVSGSLSIGDLTSFILYTLIIAFSLGTLGTLYTDFMRSIGAAERIFELLDRQPLIPNKGGRTLPRIEGRLRFENVSFSYPSREAIHALKNVSFSIEPGEVLALVGPSGSGKTTIANLIPRFYDPQQGEILLDDTPISELDPSWLREQIGTVAQEPVLFSRSILDNIGYSCESPSREAIEAAAKIANAHDFILNFPDGYETQVGERGIRLSGGQKQRIAIARAVLKDPKILILDEATSALDAQSEFLVKEALDRLREGRTTLVIAHRLSTVKDANRVLVIEGGRIVETGRHEELMAKEEGRYRQLVERQFILDGVQ